MKKLMILVALLALVGCNKAKIPSEGLLVQDCNGTEYIIKYNLGETYRVEIVPPRFEVKKIETAIMHGARPATVVFGGDK